MRLCVNKLLYAYVPTTENLFFWYTNGTYTKNAETMNARAMRN